MPLCISLDLRCVRTIQEIILRLYNHIIIIIYAALGGDELNMQKRIVSSYCCFVEPPSFNGLFTSTVFTVLAMNSGTSHEYILRIHVHVMVLSLSIMNKILHQWTLIEVIKLLCFFISLIRCGVTATISGPCVRWWFLKHEIYPHLLSSFATETLRYHCPTQTPTHLW